MINCEQIACALNGSQEATTLELTGRAGTRVEHDCALEPKSHVDLHTGHNLEPTTSIL